MVNRSLCPATARSGSRSALVGLGLALLAGALVGCGGASGGANGGSGVQTDRAANPPSYSVTAVSPGSSFIVPQQGDPLAPNSSPEVEAGPLVTKGNISYEFWEPVPDALKQGEVPTFTYFDSIDEYPKDGYTLLMVDRALVPNAEVQHGASDALLVKLSSVTDAIGADIALNTDDNSFSVTFQGTQISAKAYDIHAIVDGEAATNGAAVTSGEPTSDSGAVPSGEQITLAEGAPEVIAGNIFVPLDFLRHIPGLQVEYYDAANFPRDPDPPLWYEFPFPFPLITVDQATQTPAQTPEEALVTLKERLNEGYDYFAEALKLQEWFDPDWYPTALETLKNHIDSTFYVGEIGSYYVFRGPYEILYDKYTHDIYFYQIWAGIWKMVPFDNPQYPDLYALYYFAG